MTEFTREQKVAARKAVGRAIEAGTLKAAPCQKCGNPRAQAHHPDYSLPLDVEWLCAKCHSQLHNQKHPIEKRCEVCGELYTPHPTKRARAKTCSPKCRAALISRRLTEKPVIPPWAKLDAEKAAEIRRRYAAGGISMRAMAKEYDVHHKQISDIVRGKAWKTDHRPEKPDPKAAH